MKISKSHTIKYYDSTIIDYRLVWDLKSSLAMHYGYWDDRVRNLREALQRENEILADISKITSRSVVLDAGCGVGGSSIYLAKNIGCRVIGITISSDQVAQAKHNAIKHGVENLTEFYEMDFCNTSFMENSFDVIWAIESVCHASNKKKFILEAFRVLKKSGRLIIADGFLAKNLYSEAEQKIINTWLNGWGVNSLITSKQFEELLDEADFRVIKVKNITHKIMPSSKRLYFLSFPAFIVSKFAEVLKLRSKIQTSNVVAAYHQYKIFNQKLASYEIVSAIK